jgi:hypothetical protein
VEHICWKNPECYLRINKVQGPKNLLEIRSIRGLVSWADLSSYISTRCESALRVKELSVQHTKLHLLKYQTIDSLNVFSAMGFVVKKDSGVVAPVPSDDDAAAASSSSRQFLYYDIVFLMSNKLRIVCHDLFDEIRPGRRTLRLKLPDLVLHRTDLTKKYSKGTRRKRRARGEAELRRKVYSMYDLPMVIAKRAAPRFLKHNKESVLKIVSSGLLGTVLKRLKARRTKLRRWRRGAK